MNLRPAYLLVAVICILNSCTKIESTDIGAGLIPPVDNINTFETSLSTVTENYFDTGVVYPLRSDNLVVGRVSNDPLFGKTTAILNLQLLPEYNQFRFNGRYDSLILDSIVLVLSYKGVWGDANTTQTLNVYEIAPPDEPIKDSIYSTRKNILHEPTVLGSAVVDVNKLLGKDTLKPYNEVVNKDQIRIKITDPSMKDRLFKDTALLDSSRAFKNRIGGFAIVPDTTLGVTSNNLLVVNLADTNTKMAFYYSYVYVGQTRRDTASAYFRFTTNSGFSNQIIRNPVGAEYQQYQAAGADSLVYLQTRPDAPYAKIKIPGLDTFKNAIIHRAELLIEQVPYNSLDASFSPPALFLTAFSADSSRKFMLPGGDVQFSNNGVNNLADFGAFPYKRDQISYYSFNLTQYVQGIVTLKNRNLQLALSAPFADYIHAVEEFNTVLPITNTGVLNTLAVGRIRVGGGSHSHRKMRLRIIYTRI